MAGAQWPARQCGEFCSRQVGAGERCEVVGIHWLTCQAGNVDNSVPGMVPEGERCAFVGTTWPHVSRAVLSGQCVQRGFAVATWRRSFIFVTRKRVNIMVTWQTDFAVVIFVTCSLTFVQFPVAFGQGFPR